MLQENIVLASTSPYRKTLLARLGIPFTCRAPEIDEEAVKNECLSQKKTAVQIAEWLAYEKTASVAYGPAAGAIVIGGDQLVSLNGEILGKPGSHEKAVQQLMSMSGKTHELHTAVCILGREQISRCIQTTRLKMKNLNESEIHSYLLKDKPYNCAGSYKIEEHGIALFESVIGDDFTAIQGIPLIWLSNCLKEMGYEFFTDAT